MSKPNRATLLATVRSASYTSSGAGAALTKAIVAAASPISFIGKGDDRKLSEPCIKRVQTVQAAFMVGFVAARIADNESQAQSCERAEGIIAGVAHDAKVQAGNRVRRTKAQDAILAAGRKAWSRARIDAGLTTGDKREGNKNAKKPGSNKAPTKAPKASDMKPSAKLDSPEALWEYVAHAADTMEKTVNKAHAKIAPNNLSRLVNEFFIAVRAAMPSE